MFAITSMLIEKVGAREGGALVGDPNFVRQGA
jgi:hypothetical protein